MAYNPNIHHRRSVRLKNYDYSKEGMYFITINCHKRNHLFGHIENKEMILNDAGEIAHACWLEIPSHFPHAILHNHIIMPNHMHGIIELITRANDDDDTIRANNNSPDSHPPDTHPHDIHPPDTHPHDIHPHDIHPHDIHPPDPAIGANNNDPAIGANNYSPLWRSPSKTIGSIVRGYKIGVTKWMRQNTDIYDVWQRNYFVNIIRDELSYQNITDYIIHNPKKWAEDTFQKK
ncbi:MAG: transposase [Bacteroidetes bacterium]|nr:transposase [Bacteroidota bacterium]